jgi:D-3-phosphoglycerate dehydrogenase
MGLILAEIRHIARAYHSLKIGRYLGKPAEREKLPAKKDVIWELDGESPYKKFKGFELSGRTLGLIGLGSIGMRLAKLAKAFGMRVVAFDPYCGEERAREAHVKLLDLKEVLMLSDILSIHCKVTDETIGLIGKEQLALMKPTAYIINTARAAVIQEDALIEALQNKMIAGAALDVFWDEPLPANHPLLMMDNVTITPHLGGASYDVPVRHSQMMIEDVIRWIKNQQPVNVFS